MHSIIRILFIIIINAKCVNTNEKLFKILDTEEKIQPYALHNNDPGMIIFHRNGVLHIQQHHSVAHL